MKPSDNPPIPPEERCKSCDKHRALDSGLCFACGRAAEVLFKQQALAGLRTARGLPADPSFEEKKKFNRLQFRSRPKPPKDWRLREFTD